MISVNLLSSAVLEARNRSHRIRRWIVVASVTAAVSAIPVTLDLVQRARVSALMQRAAPLAERQADAQNQLKLLTLHGQEQAERLARADALRAKRSWAALLGAITRQAPDEVWLVDVETMGGDAAGRAAPAPPPAARGAAAAPARVSLEGPTAIRIAGFALDHEWLYEFVGRLKRAGLFETVELVQAGRLPVMQGQAVRFSLECTW